MLPPCSMLLESLQGIRGFSKNGIRYINPHFTYLLTYLDAATYWLGPSSEFLTTVRFTTGQVPL